MSESATLLCTYVGVTNKSGIRVWIFGIREENQIFVLFLHPSLSILFVATLEVQFTSSVDLQNSPMNSC